MKSSEIYTLLITYEHGNEVSLHATEQDALDAAYDYVEEMWQYSFPSKAMPTKKSRAIDYYFSNNYDDDYKIESHPIPRVVEESLPQFLNRVADEIETRDTLPGTFAPNVAASLKGRAILLQMKD